MNPQMEAAFRAAIGEYVGRVEAVQSEMLALQRRKRTALAAADAAGLQAMESPERQASDRLKALVAERQQMLVRAGQFGLPTTSLADVAGKIRCDVAVVGKIESCRKRAAALRREGWVQWVVAKRSLAQNGALLDLIAQKGGRPPTYDRPLSTAGGTLLDARA